MEEWPLTHQELIAAKPLLKQKVSFLDVARQSSRKVETCWHKSFTHRCVCPFHASGLERTPSLYFSEKTKKFHCFACDVHGDLFDFIGLVEGKPWFSVVLDLLDVSDIDTDQIDIADIENTVSHDTVYRLNFGLALRFRDYLKEFEGTDLFAQLNDALYKMLNTRYI